MTLELAADLASPSLGVGPDDEVVSKSNSEGRTVRALDVLVADSSPDAGLGGRGRQPAGSEVNEIGRDLEDSAMDVGRDEAGGVGGKVGKEDRLLLVLSRRRSSKRRRSPRD